MPEFRTLGFALVDWIEHYLVHGPGDVQGQDIELDDEFAAFILKAYEVADDGERKVRRAFLSRSKGRSKSGLAAMLVCVEALGPCRFDHWAEAGEVSSWGYEYEEGEPVGRPLPYVEVLNVATEEGQAGNTYDAVYYMLNADTAAPELVAEFGKLDVGLTRINLPNKRGFIEPVTSADSSKDGGKSTFIVADETHLWKLDRLKRLHGIMTRNLLKRKAASGWMLETSTMYGEGEDSVAEGTHAYAKAIAEGRRKDRTLLFDHRQAADTWNLEKRADRIKALREAYGPAAAWMNLEAIADSWDDPQTKEADFRRYWLNQPVPTDEVPPSAVAGWRSRVAVVDIPTPLVAGVAVSVGRTWSAVVTGGRGENGKVLGLTVHREGTGWLGEYLKRVQDEYGIAVVMDESGPGGYLIPSLEEAGIGIEKANSGRFAEACAALADEVRDGGITILPHVDFDTAFEGTRWRDLGDRQVFARKKSVSDISVSESAALASWALDNVMTSFNVW